MPILKKLSVFIDFDGVFHPVGACAWLESENRHHFVQPFRWWPQFRDALKPLDMHVELVVHSTWRNLWETDDELRALLPEPMRAMVVGCTPREIMGRARSIEAYVADKGLEHFVVIDDEAGAFPENYAPLVVCAPEKGILDEDVQAKLYLKVKAGLVALGHIVQ